MYDKVCVCVCFSGGGDWSQDLVPAEWVVYHWAVRGQKYSMVISKDAKKDRTTSNRKDGRHGDEEPKINIPYDTAGPSLADFGYLQK